MKPWWCSVNWSVPALAFLPEEAEHREGAVSCEMIASCLWTTVRWFRKVSPWIYGPRVHLQLLSSHSANPVEWFVGVSFNTADCLYHDCSSFGQPWQGLQSRTATSLHRNVVLGNKKWTSTLKELKVHKKHSSCLSKSQDKQHIMVCSERNWLWAVRGHCWKII